MENNEVLLDGIETFKTDDGYRKTSGKRAFHRRMLIDRAWLIQYMGADSAIVFYRTGKERPTTFPTWKRPVSQPSAMRTVTSMEKGYASLKSYRDDASFRSLVDTETPESAMIHFRFDRPKRFLLQVVTIHPPIPVISNEIGTDDRGSWMYKRGYNSTLEKREIEQSFGTISASGDSWPIYQMLMGKSGFLPLSKEAWLLSKSNETIQGHACNVVIIRTILGTDTTLWIDSSSHLIRRFENGFDGQRIEHKPEANIAIPAKEFDLRLKSMAAG